MTAELDADDPRLRIERSRRSLAREMDRRSGRRHADTHDGDGLRNARRARPDGLLARVGHAASKWWYEHPVHTAVEIARPALEDYARQRPLNLLGIAAGTGAALTVLKSWRLLSLTGVALAMLKSSDLVGTVRDLVMPSPLDE